MPTIPLIPEKLFLECLASLCRGIDPARKHEAYDIVQSGLGSMGLTMLGANFLPPPTFRERVTEAMGSDIENEEVARTFTKAETWTVRAFQTLAPFTWVLAYAALRYNMAIGPLDRVPLFTILASSGIVFLGISMALNWLFKKRHRVGSTVKSRLAQAGEQGLMDAWKKMSYGPESPRACMILCECILLVDQERFMPRLQRLDGARGEAIDAINDGLSFIESLCMYQNLVTYFNEVYPSIRMDDIGGIEGSKIPFDPDRLNGALAQIDSRLARDQETSLPTENGYRPTYRVLEDFDTLVAEAQALAGTLQTRLKTPPCRQHDAGLTDVSNHPGLESA